MNEKQRFIVVGNTPEGKVFAWGTPTGRPFGSKRRAEAVAQQIQEQYPMLNGAIALELHGFVRRNNYD